MRRKPTRYHSRANIYYDIGRKAVAEEAFPEQGKQKGVGKKSTCGLYTGTKVQVIYKQNLRFYTMRKIKAHRYKDTWQDGTHAWNMAVKKGTVHCF